MRISDWSSDVCSSDLRPGFEVLGRDRADVGLDQLADLLLDRHLLDQRVDARLGRGVGNGGRALRSEEHTSELQSLMRISYAVFCLKKKNKQSTNAISHRMTLTN